MRTKVLEMARMHAKELPVPDSLWTNAALTEGAKLLWCYLRVAGPERKHFTFTELRRATGLSQNSLLKHLKELATNRWLIWSKGDLRSIVCDTTGRNESAALSLPADLLFDRRLSHRAKWVWGVIRSLEGPFDHDLLRQKTGYAAKSLRKYLRQLCETGWVSACERSAPFTPKAVNPLEIQRQAQLSELALRFEIARRQDGYSVGQCLLACMVELIAAESMIVENAEVTGLENKQTGGRMHYDLLLPKQKVALEFHGPQHDGPSCSHREYP